jgi:hypothetical protein
MEGLALSAMFANRVCIKTATKAAKTQIHFSPLLLLYLGHAEAQLVEALRYKSEGRGFDPLLCHWNDPLT